MSRLLLTALVALTVQGCAVDCGPFSEVTEPVRVGDYSLLSLHHVESDLALAGASDLVLRVSPSKDEVVLQYSRNGETIVETWSVVAIREGRR